MSTLAAAVTAAAAARTTIPNVRLKSIML